MLAVIVVFDCIDRNILLYRCIDNICIRDGISPRVVRDGYEMSTRWVRDGYEMGKR